jgi:drug/metabolite transporter superfamily protein YnfA
VLEYVLMFAAGVSALWGLNQDASTQGNLLAMWGGIYIAVSMWVDKRWRKSQTQQANKNGSDDAA